MKRLITLALTFVALAVFTGLCIGQSAQQQSPPTSIDTKLTTTGEKVYGASSTAQVAVDSGRDTKKVVAEAIAATIVTRKGKAFPLVAKGSGSDAIAAGGASCELYDTQTFTHGAAIDLESPYHVKKTNTYPSAPPQEAIYSAPNADWVVQSYYRVITSTGPPYVAADSAFPAGYSFLTNSNYSSVSSTMHSFVGSLNVNGQVKVDLNAKLDTFISNVSAYSYSLSGSHATVRHTATVWGTGVLNWDVGHSWYHGYINGTLVCAPAYLHDQNALTVRLKTWVNSVIRKLPYSLTNEAVKQ